MISPVFLERYQHLAALMAHQVKIEDNITDTLAEVKFLHA